MKRLPVVSVIRFRSVSKQWKSLIESYEFINDHTRINGNRSQHHLLVRHKSNIYEDPQYTSIVDDYTFPNQISSLTFPPPALSRLTPYYLNTRQVLGVNGVLCIEGIYLMERMAVLWNPIIRKSVGIVIPSGLNTDFVIGFGFCSDTSDPKLVKVNRYYESEESDVMVFTLSSCVWQSISNVPPSFGSSCPLYQLYPNQVCIKGCIYWWAKDRSSGEDGETNAIVSFDLESEKFGQVHLPECLLQTNDWKVAEVNESLGVLANDYEEDRVCGVWIMDFVSKTFTKMCTIKQPRGKWLYNELFGVSFVLGFRKNGEVIIEVQEDGINISSLEVYEPASSGHINGIGINGKPYMQMSVSLYMTA